MKLTGITKGDKIVGMHVLPAPNSFLPPRNPDILITSIRDETMMKVSLDLAESCNPKQLPLDPIMFYKPDTSAARRRIAWKLSRKHRVGFITHHPSMSTKFFLNEETTLAVGRPRTQVSFGNVPHNLGSNVLVVFQTENKKIFVASIDFRDITSDIPRISYSEFTRMITQTLTIRVTEIESEEAYDPGEPTVSLSKTLALTKGMNN